MNELDKVKELMAICADINGTEGKREGDGPCVFAKLSGHIAALEISIYNNGWGSSNDRDAEFIFYMDTDFGDSYEEIRNHLLELKKCAGATTPCGTQDKSI